MSKPSLLKKGQFRQGLKIPGEIYVLNGNPPPDVASINVWLTVMSFPYKLMFHAIGLRDLKCVIVPVLGMNTSQFIYICVCRNITYETLNVNR
jgi:hypothetical protein